jgi:hypothetical protein
MMRSYTTACWRRVAASGLAAVLLLVTHIALGDAMPKVPPGFRLPIGIWTAVAIHDDATDGFMGALEASIVYTDRDYDWVGGYVDFGRDFASDRTRLSVGPEIGSGFFGIDAGYAAELGGPSVRHGYVIRPLLSLGVIILGGRLGHFFGDAEETFGEVGLLFKFPIELAVDRKPQWYDPQPVDVFTAPTL